MVKVCINRLLIQDLYMKPEGKSNGRSPGPEFHEPMNFFGTELTEPTKLEATLQLIPDTLGTRVLLGSAP